MYSLSLYITAIDNFVTLFDIHLSGKKANRSILGEKDTLFNVLLFWFWDQVIFVSICKMAFL